MFGDILRNVLCNYLHFVFFFFTIAITESYKECKLPYSFLFVFSLQHYVYDKYTAMAFTMSHNSLPVQY